MPTSASRIARIVSTRAPMSRAHDRPSASPLLTVQVPCRRGRDARPEYFTPTVSVALGPWPVLGAAAPTAWYQRGGESRRRDEDGDDEQSCEQRNHTVRVRRDRARHCRVGTGRYETGWEGAPRRAERSASDGSVVG